jgi:hypothetical protein
VKAVLLPTVASDRHTVACLDLWRLLDQLIPAPHEIVRKGRVGDWIAEAEHSSRQRAVVDSELRRFAGVGAGLDVIAHERERTRLEAFVRETGDTFARVIMAVRTRA